MKENVIQCNTSKSYSNSNTCDMVKEVKRDYYQKWRDNNKDKIKEYNSNYWQKRAEKIKNNSSKTK